MDFEEEWSRKKGEETRVVHCSEDSRNKQRDRGEMADPERKEGKWLRKDQAEGS